MVNTMNTEKKESLGLIKISEEVVSIIAAVAASEVAGVAGMSSTLVDGLVNILGRNNLSRGVKSEMKDNAVDISLYLVVQYGYRIPDIALQAQEQVKSAIEAMTDYKVTSVNLYIQGIDFEPAEKDPASKQGGKNEH